MAVLLYHTFAFVALFSYGIYHLISSTRSFFKSPSSAAPRGGASTDFSARPYYPLPLPPHRHHLIRHLPLYLSLLSLLLSIAHFTLQNPSPTSLHSAAALLLFLLLALSLLILPPLPPDLLHLLAALAFALLACPPSSPSASPSLRSHCAAISSLISSSSAAFSVALALLPHLYILSLALSASLALQGLWSLQTGLSLYADAFIPDGCHRLLDLPEAASTRCDLEDSRLRALALLDLAFVLHATFVAVVSVTVYLAVARSSGGLVRRHGDGSYEALPTSSSSGTLPDLDHVQLKAIAKNSAQA